MRMKIRHESFKLEVMLYSAPVRNLAQTFVSKKRPVLQFILGVAHFLYSVTHVQAFLRDAGTDFRAEKNVRAGTHSHLELLQAPILRTEKVFGKLSLTAHFIVAHYVRNAGLRRETRNMWECLVLNIKQ